MNAQIPKGKVATYGKIARLLHSSPRSVGQALKVCGVANRLIASILFAI